MRISDWSSDVCSSDQPCGLDVPISFVDARVVFSAGPYSCSNSSIARLASLSVSLPRNRVAFIKSMLGGLDPLSTEVPMRSEEHTSELQSLMRISYAVFCLKKKKLTRINNIHKQLPH